MAKRAGSGRRARWQGLTLEQFIFGMLVVVAGAVITDQLILPAFKQPGKFVAPQVGAQAGVFARSTDEGQGVTLPIGGPNLLTAYETPPDLDVVHSIKGTNAAAAAAAQPARAETPSQPLEEPVSEPRADSSGRWLVDSDQQFALPPNWQRGYFSAPVGGFRGFPGGIGSGSVKGRESERDNS